MGGIYHQKLKDTNYDAWTFGDGPDSLARPVLETATSSAFPVYEWEGKPLPEAGEYSVVLDVGMRRYALS